MSLQKLKYTLWNKYWVQMWEYNIRLKSDLAPQAITPPPSTILILCPRWSDDISAAPNKGGEVIIRKVTGEIHGMGDWWFPNAMPKYRQRCHVFALKRLVYFVLLTHVPGNWKYFRHITSNHTYMIGNISSNCVLSFMKVVLIRPSQFLWQLPLLSWNMVTITIMVCVQDTNIVLRVIFADYSWHFFCNQPQIRGGTCLIQQTMLLKWGNSVLTLSCKTIFGHFCS